MRFPKDYAFRSESYRRYVASKDCFGCGISGYSQCAHQNLGKGRGIKVDDRLSFPLCSTRPGHQGCHVLHDLCVDMTREERRGIERDFVQRMQAMARADGRKEFLEAA